MCRKDRGLGACRLALVTVMLALVAGCVVGPDYMRPGVITPDAYKEVDGWIAARPQDEARRGAWWEIFADPQLNALAAQVSVSNQTLAVAEAQDVLTIDRYAHLVGGCAMSNSSETGVIDSNHRAWGVPSAHSQRGADQTLRSGTAHS